MLPRCGVLTALGCLFLAMTFTVFRGPRAEEPAILLHTHDEEVGPQILQENPAVATVRCIAGRLGRAVEIRRAPRLRNSALLAVGRIDGMFPNMPDDELEKHAVPTEPFVLERWSYIQRRDSRNPARPRGHTVGVVLGSDESRFLATEQVEIFDAIPNTQSLVRLLATRRLPYVMVDDWSFDREAAALGYASDAFRSAIVRYVPLQAYFSQSFAGENPGFVPMFNESVRHCVHDGRKVAIWEREVLARAADRIMADRREAILEYLMKNRSLDAADPLPSRIAALAEADAAWRRALKEDRMTTLMEVILENPVSDLLRGIASEYPLVTEIFVTDADGFVIGLNRLTSDYWQGDESAAAAVLTGADERHFSDFEYDSSTRRFQVQLSLPLHDPAGPGTPIGMITIGLDAAQVLAGQMH